MLTQRVAGRHTVTGPKEASVSQSNAAQHLRRAEQQVDAPPELMPAGLLVGQHRLPRQRSILGVPADALLAAHERLRHGQHWPGTRTRHACCRHPDSRHRALHWMGLECCTCCFSREGKAAI